MFFLFEIKKPYKILLTFLNRCDNDKKKLFGIGKINELIVSDLYYFQNDPVLFRMLPL